MQLDDGETISDEEFELELGGRTTHPAEDLSAKWKLSRLFDDALGAPISFAFQ